MALSASATALVASARALAALACAAFARSRAAENSSSSVLVLDLVLLDLIFLLLFIARSHHRQATTQAPPVRPFQAAPRRAQSGIAQPGASLGTGGEMESNAIAR